MAEEPKADPSVVSDEALLLQAHDALEAAREALRGVVEPDDRALYEKVNSALYAIRGRPVHASDCAMHNEPAMPNGSCDCQLADTRAPSDAALVEALEPFARAYERWADGGNLKGWQAERMKQSVDAHRYCVAFEALAAAKGQQPALDRNTVNGGLNDGL